MPQISERGNKMSFSSEAKGEICKNQISDKCCALSELYGVFMFCNTLSDKEIKIITSSEELGKRLPRLMKKAFGFGFDRVPEENSKSVKQVFSITEADKINTIFDAYGQVAGAILAHHINFGALEEECCKLSFVRGAFLSGGSVTDPKKGYHLEFATSHFNVSREMSSILLELGFFPKSVMRKGNYIIYFKQSEVIEDILTTLGAPVSAMKIMSAKVEKDMYNAVNRKVNCDTANVSKIVEASAGQIEAIVKLKKTNRLETMPEKLRETAKLRYDNPELSLSELAELFDPPITKSCLSHRLRKIAEAAEEE